jgi:hypothetical protein
MSLVSLELGPLVASVSHFHLSGGVFVECR